MSVLDFLTKEEYSCILRREKEDLDSFSDFFFSVFQSNPLFNFVFINESIDEKILAE